MRHLQGWRGQSGSGCSFREDVDKTTETNNQTQNRPSQVTHDKPLTRASKTASPFSSTAGCCVIQAAELENLPQGGNIPKRKLRRLNVPPCESDLLRTTVGFSCWRTSSSGPVKDLRRHFSPDPRLEETASPTARFEAESSLNNLHGDRLATVKGLKTFWPSVQGLCNTLQYCTKPSPYQLPWQELNPPPHRAFELHIAQLHQTYQGSSANSPQRVHLGPNLSAGAFTLNASRHKTC